VSLLKPKYFFPKSSYSFYPFNSAGSFCCTSRIVGALRTPNPDSRFNFQLDFRTGFSYKSSWVTDNNGTAWKIKSKGSISDGKSIPITFRHRVCQRINQSIKNWRIWIRRQFWSYNDKNYLTSIVAYRGGWLIAEDCYSGVVEQTCNDSRIQCFMSLNFILRISLSLKTLRRWPFNSIYIIPSLNRERLAPSYPRKVRKIPFNTSTTNSQLGGDRWTYTARWLGIQANGARDLKGNDWG